MVVPIKKSSDSIKRVYKAFLILAFLFPFRELGGRLFAHPMPNSMVLLKIHDKTIKGEIQLPLGELQSAIGMNVNDNSNRLLERLSDSLRLYILQHIRPKTFDGKPWKVTLGDMKLHETKSKLTGDYKELIVEFTMTPPQFYDLRNFLFEYDVILHQVASHKAIIAIKQDWQQGIVNEDSSYQQVGVIEWDIASNKLNPFQISLQQGSDWTGFKSMVSLGAKHIAEGTDHLLFLLVLLLPIPLLVDNKKWNQSKAIKPSLIHIFKIVTAFTFGHSLTLLIGSVGANILPSKIIEVLIAVSILVSAVHAIKPIFEGKEVLIALGFGFIHGLAFANSITDLQLSPTKLLLSILGFNIGIELMQLLVIVAVIPWLILMSRSNFYSFCRITGAILAAVAAVGWILERLKEESNIITELISKLANHSIWLLCFLVVFSLVSYYLKKLDTK
jgi:hypothetical protein